MRCRLCALLQLYLLPCRGLLHSCHIGPVLAAFSYVVLHFSATGKDKEMVCYLVKEITVMRNNEHTAREGLQILLQHIKSYYVKVVCRLIQNKEIGIPHKHRKQIEPPALTAA